jgi:hypothetical protein
MAGTTVTRHPPSAGRCGMDFAYRSPVGRFAERQSFPAADLPLPLPALAAGRPPGQDIAGAGQRSASGLWGTGFDRGLHRRLLQRAQKGALQWVQHAAAKGARSCPSRTARVLRSPRGLQALRQTRLNLPKPHSDCDSRWPRPSTCSLIARLTGIRWPGSWQTAPA